MSSNKKVKVLYIATTAKKRNRLDGETVKCKLLEEYLRKNNEIIIRAVDTDNWKKHIIKLVFLIIFNYFWCDKIIVSAADNGSNIVLSFFNKIKTRKEIYYFVIGGSLYRNIKEKNWSVLTYKKIKKVYVEAKILKKDLNSLLIDNVEVLNNFRKVENFEKKYIKTEEIKFVFYGRVIKEKGIEQAIRLINRLNENGYNCTLDIYGQIKHEYKAELAEDFNKNIRYNGEIKPNNKSEYEILSKYDIFILPTEYPGECLPGALIDAYISGLAVVVSNWKYAKEYVKENENGVIFQYKNYEDMYVKTKEMIDNTKIEKFKRKSMEMSKKYIIDDVLKLFIELMVE